MNCRSGIVGLCCTFCLVIACRQSEQKAIISGGSMYPALTGEYFELICQDCKFAFLMDATQTPQSGQAVCPNCGFREILFNGLPRQVPEPLILLPLEKSIERWEMVAFVMDRESEAEFSQPSKPTIRIPNRPVDQKFLVKRVVGLPGETVDIRYGNIYIDGIVAHRSDELKKQMSLHVFDSQYLSAESQIQRWIADRADSNWSWVEGSGWRFAAEVPMGQPDWLIYRHVRGYRHSGDRDSASGLDDSYGYNQNLSRQLNPVIDIHVTLQVVCSNKASILLRLDNPAHHVMVELACGESQIVVYNQGEQQVFPVEQITPGKSSELAISNIDFGLVVWWDGIKVVHLQLSEPSGSVSAGTTLAVGGQRGEFIVERMRIRRDVYYYSGDTYVHASPKSVHLGADEYFVCGDNVPISVDSRHFGLVHRGQLVGRLQIEPK